MKESQCKQLCQLTVIDNELLQDTSAWPSSTTDSMHTQQHKWECQQQNIWRWNAIGCDRRKRRTWNTTSL